MRPWRRADRGAHRRPQGGHLVTLHDPEGFTVNLLHGQTKKPAGPFPEIPPTKNFKHVESAHLAEKTNQTKAVQDAVKQLGARAYFVDLSSQGSDVECDYHPNAATHAALVAHASAAGSAATSLSLPESAAEDVAEPDPTDTGLITAYSRGCTDDDWVGGYQCAQAHVA
ncbi:hypothetical protein EJ07DRAFT_151693 [Lizonia empirigonia]|nr:hypothetical protein EJ07DRAFT_151693 [Lizonia empirigonia]